jgi:hypothetical protein
MRGIPQPRGRVEDDEFVDDTVLVEEGDIESISSDNGFKVFRPVSPARSRSSTSSEETNFANVKSTFKQEVDALRARVGSDDSSSSSDEETRKKFKHKKQKSDKKKRAITQPNTEISPGFNNGPESRERSETEERSMADFIRQQMLQNSQRGSESENGEISFKKLPVLGL